MPDITPEEKTGAVDEVPFTSTGPSEQTVAGTPLAETDKLGVDLDAMLEAELREIQGLPPKAVEKTPEPVAVTPAPVKVAPAVERAPEPKVEAPALEPVVEKRHPANLSEAEKKLIAVRNYLSQTDEGRQLAKALDAESIVATEGDIDRVFMREMRRHAQVASIRAQDKEGVLTDAHDQEVLEEHEKLKKTFGNYVSMELAYNQVRSRRVGDFMKRHEEVLRSQSRTETMRKMETAGAIKPEVGSISVSNSQRPQPVKKDLWKEVEAEIKANWES